MEQFTKLAIIAQKTEISESDLLRMASEGKISLSVWFEGVLLDDIGPDNMHNIEEGMELLQMASPEIHRLMAQGKCSVRLGQILYVPKTIHKGLAQLPIDELHELLARGGVKASCLQVGDKDYRCHAMPTSEYDSLRRDRERIRLLCEGKTVKSPEYTLQDLCITDSEAEKARNLQTIIPDAMQQQDDNLIVATGWPEILTYFGKAYGTICLAMKAAGIDKDTLKEPSSKNQRAITLRKIHADEIKNHLK